MRSCQGYPALGDTHLSPTHGCPRRVSPEIGCDAVGCAIQFVLHQTRRMLFMAAGHVAKSEFDAKCKERIRVLQAWRGKHPSDLRRRMW